jgi:hypothetical protein
MKMQSKLQFAVATLVALGLAPSLALAQGSPGATAVTAVTAAQADGLLVAAALTGMAIAVWAALYIKRKFFGS